MGRGLLVLFAGAVFVSGFYLVGISRTAHETSAEQSGFEDKIIAKEIATSAYNAAVSEIRRDFEGWRSSVADKAYQGGTYTLTTSGPAEGPVQITIQGNFGGAWHSISGSVVQSLGYFLDAITFDTEGVACQASGASFNISGMDYLPPSEGGGDGDGPDVHAVRALQSVVHTDLVACLPPDQTQGVDGAGDIVEGAPPNVDLEDLYQETAVLSTTTYLDNQTFSTEVFGAPNSPVVIEVIGDLTLNGNTVGYGILYVNGDLKMSGSARWEGLVLVGNAAEEIKFAGNSRVYGSIVLRGGGDCSSEEGKGGKGKGGKEKGGGECGGGGALDFKVAGSSGVYYSSKALMRMKDLLPAIDDAIDIAVVGERDQESNL